MKTNLTRLNASAQAPTTQCPPRPRPKAWGSGVLLSLALGAQCFHARAVLPEPDNVVFGTIALDGRAITAADYDVVVEVRLAAAGPAVASYQMGASPRLGNYYSVRVPLESLPPKTDENAALAGDVVYVVISDINGERETRPLTVGARGAFQRLDIGAAVPDADSDGLPDAWETLYFGNTSVNPGGDNDSDGVTNGNEYTAGTDPSDANSYFRLAIVPTPAGADVSFIAQRAQGPGYEGRSRYYDLERSTSLAGGGWGSVAGYSNILGTAQNVVYPIPAALGPVDFFRCRVRLEAP